MNIFLIIIGAILTLFCGVVALGTHLAVKNQENWDDFYKSFQKSGPAVPEETVYNLVCKLNYWFSLGLIIGILLLIGGILLQIIK